jgi:hypothetical protein
MKNVALNTGFGSIARDGDHKSRYAGKRKEPGLDEALISMGETCTKNNGEEKVLGLGNAANCLAA